MKIKFTFLLLLLTVSCSDNSEKGSIFKQVEIKKMEAIKVHDGLMAQMGELRSLKKRLQVVLLNNDSIGGTGSIDIAIKSVEKADKSMWDWMHGFDVTYKSDEDSITLRYYQLELERIKEVKGLFDSAIYHSTQLLE